MTRCIVELCSVFLLAGSVVLAQETKSNDSAAKANLGATNSSKTALEDFQALRKQQLAVLQEHILNRTLDSIRNMDEAGLRMSARNEVLSYLTGNKAESREDEAIASKLAVDALADFDSHSGEIPSFMADYLLSDLGAWIEKHRPQLAEKFRAVEKTKTLGKETDHIRSLLELKDDDALAAQRIRQRFEAGQDVDGLIFYLDDLMKRNSNQLESLLFDIVVFAERGPQVSLQTLFWISDVYFRSGISESLKRRFLGMVLSRTHPANFISEPAPQSAFDLLTRVLPAVHELSPELYEQAVNQSFSIRASLSERQLASEARAKRLRDSLNPIEDLASEAAAAKFKGERNELLAAAAHLALEKKKLSLCLEIVAKIDPEVTASSLEFWRNWIDQFLKDFVKAALATKDTELAEKGADRIVSPLARVEGLVLMMRYAAKTNDMTGVQRLLAEASRIAGNVSGAVEKGKAFFLLSITCDLSDESQKAQLLESGIKALNNLSKPDSGGNDRKPYEQYVRSLDNAGNELRKSFRELTKKDENGAISLAEKVQKPDLKTFAMIGILQGLDELLLATPN